MLGRWALTIAALAPIGLAAQGASAASWSAQAPANPASSTGSVLDGLSCSTLACTAVGWSTDPLIGAQTLAERRESGAWAIQPTPNPTAFGGDQGELMAVSCPGQRRCEAVANTAGGIGNDMFAEGWNGSRWRIQNVPEPADDTHTLDSPQNDFLNGISCPRANLCIAVGSYDNGSGVTFPLTERWNGKGWKVLPKAKMSAGKSLHAVSCTGPIVCTAVGGSVVERWNGRAWTVKPAQRPSGGRSLSLDGVSCVSARRCVAVGSYRGKSQRTLAELWNGRRWTVLRTLVSGGLAGVSCVSARVCVAVGATSGKPRSTLAEGWNGTSWAIQATPGAGGQASELNAVSCSAVSACTAVGDAGTGQQPLALVYS